MKNFHGYKLKIYDEKCEIYENKKLIATEDDEEKAKSYIIKVLEEEKEE